jgi:hypothetical protein
VLLAEVGEVLDPAADRLQVGEGAEPVLHEERRLFGMQAQGNVGPDQAGQELVDLLDFLLRHVARLSEHEQLRPAGGDSREQVWRDLQLLDKRGPVLERAELVRIVDELFEVLVTGSALHRFLVRHVRTPALFRVARPDGSGFVKIPRNFRRAHSATCDHPVQDADDAEAIRLVDDLVPDHPGFMATGLSGSPAGPNVIGFPLDFHVGSPSLKNPPE